MNPSSSIQHATEIGCGHIVVTRPRAQLQGLVDLLVRQVLAAGHKHKVLGLPLLEIEPLGDASLAQQLYEDLGRSDLTIFVSPNAVISAKSLLNAHQLDWPKVAHLAVVGGGTEQSIKASGLVSDSLMKPAANSAWDSEGLWAVLNTPDISWGGKKVTFVKGLGGRPWLMDQLTQQGAEVHGFEVYQRTPLSVTDAAWIKVAHLYQNEINRQFSDVEKPIWLLTSSEAVLQIPNSFEQLGIPVDALKQSKAICSHQRILEAAVKVGFGDVKLCDAGDLNLVDATLSWLENPKA